MTVLYYPIPAIASGVAAHRAATMLQLPGLAAIIVAIVAGVLGMMAWSYSPLPDHNGGMLAGTKNKGWGW